MQIRLEDNIGYVGLYLNPNQFHGVKMESRVIIEKERTLMGEERLKLHLLSPHKSGHTNENCSYCLKPEHVGHGCWRCPFAKDM